MKCAHCDNRATFTCADCRRRVCLWCCNGRPRQVSSVIELESVCAPRCVEVES